MESIDAALEPARNAEEAAARADALAEARKHGTPPRVSPFDPVAREAEAEHLGINDSDAAMWSYYRGLCDVPYLLEPEFRVLPGYCPNAVFVLLHGEPAASSYHLALPIRWWDADNAVEFASADLRYLAGIYECSARRIREEVTLDDPQSVAEFRGAHDLEEDPGVILAYRLAQADALARRDTVCRTLVEERLSDLADVLREEDDPRVIAETMKDFLWDSRCELIDALLSFSPAFEFIRRIRRPPNPYLALEDPLDSIL